MKIRKVTIQNLNSIRRKVTVNFNRPPLRDTGLFAITGETGAGKTTILDAITLAMYGKIHRNKDVEEVMSYGTAECMAEVEFDDGKDRYLAKWCLWRAHNRLDGNLRPVKREVARWDPEKLAFIILAEGVREADQAIEEATGLDYDRFCRSVLLAQGDFAAFLQASEKERSDLLERITGTEIYSRLSQAAFERNKLETQKLQELQQQRSALHILEEEAVTELRADLRNNQKKAAAFRSTLNKLRADVAWLEKRRDLEKRLSALKKDTVRLEQLREDLAPKLERLSRYEKIRPLEHQLNRLDELIQQSEKFKQEKEQLLEELERLDIRHQKAKEKAEALQAALARAQTELAEKRPVMEKVIQLDLSLREKEIPLRKSEQNLERVKATWERLVEEKRQNGEERETIRRELQELQEWLTAHAHLHEIQDDLSRMEELVRRWREKNEEWETLSRQKEALQEEVQQKQRCVAKTGKQVAEITAAIEKLEKKFREKTPKNFVAGRSDLLEAMSREIDVLNQRRESLQELFRLSGEYQELLRQQEKSEDELEALRGEEHHLNKMLMTQMEMLDDLKQKVDYRERVYRQQQMIANYEQDRQHLAEGEACPLCFSTSHPFREMNIEPYVDEAKNELTQVADRQEKASRDYNELMKQQTGVIMQIEQLIGDEQENKGRRKELQERIEYCESEIRKVLPALDEEVVRVTQVQHLRVLLSESEEKIIHRRRQREKLQELHRQLEAKEHDLRSRKEALSTYKTELKLTEKEYANKEAEAGNRLLDANKALQGLQEALGPYQLSVKEEDPGQIIDRLRQLKSEYLDRQETFRRKNQDLRLNEERSTQLKLQEKQQGELMETLHEEVEKARVEVRQLHQERTGMFGQADPLAERERLEKTLGEKTADYDECQHSLADLRVEQQGLRARVQDKTTALSDTGDTLNRLRRTLEAQLTTAGLEGLPALREALLAPEELRHLEHERKEQEQKEVEARKALADKKEELERHLEKDRGEVAETELLQQISDEEAALASLLEESGAIRERLKENERRQKEAESLLDRIRQQERECRRWGKLNDVIGMSDGKKFRVFAQGLTLKRLVSLANVHLAKLNGRYLIRKRREEDLDLEIVDTFQADHARSMNTLSGGESFLVSLAMALGLSDLAGQQTNIRSLFIDEGFGSLDENSLDLAISTLENLQAGGKTIGIISHVKELKERIAVQIWVKKGVGGFSRIEIVG